MDISSLILLLFLGVGAGFIAGLLGVGGGLVLVPFMTYLMSANGFPAALATHMAIATALSTIVFTSLASMRSHHQHQAVRWDLVWRLVPGIMLGAWLGPYLSTYVSGRLMALFFALFAIVSATQILLNKKPQAKSLVPAFATLLPITTVIGVVASIVGAGGGAMTVPFLVRCNIAMHSAVGTSTAMGFPIALVGTLANIYYGWHLPELPAGAAGYLYLPALAAVVVGSIFSAHFGAKAAHRLSVMTLKKIFAVILYGLASYMLWRAM